MIDLYSNPTTVEGTDLPVSYTDVNNAARYLIVQAKHTPVMTSRTVNKLTQSEVFFKCENFQRTGSFKFRGAYNALVQLSYEQKHRGVLTYSSGNHAQALALAGQLLGIRPTIVMPEDAPEVKKTATLGYGSEVIFYNPQETTREEFAQKIADERGKTIIPPYDDRTVISGQGTVGQRVDRRSWTVRYFISMLWGWWVIGRMRDRGTCPVSLLPSDWGRTSTSR